MTHAVTFHAQNFRGQKVIIQHGGERPYVMTRQAAKLLVKEFEAKGASDEGKADLHRLAGEEFAAAHYHGSATFWLDLAASLHRTIYVDMTHVG